MMINRGTTVESLLSGIQVESAYIHPNPPPNVVGMVTSSSSSATNIPAYSQPLQQHYLDSNHTTAPTSITLLNSNTWNILLQLSHNRQHVQDRNLPRYQRYIEKYLNRLMYIESNSV
uniref:Coiled-coil domain-containing protein 63 n=1 Tax=Lygus hesperus TaxID=30085 RepID=A0A0A9X0X2_LYGHE